MIGPLGLSRGADVNLTFAFGLPLTAAWKGDAEILQILLDHGALPNSEFRTQTALHLAAVQGSLPSVEAFVKADADVNALTKFREPPIHYARANGHEAVAKYLLDQGYIFPTVTPIAGRLRNADPEHGHDLFAKECSRCHVPARK